MRACVTKARATVYVRVYVKVERFRDSHFTDRITYRQSVKLIRNLEFRASFAQLYSATATKSKIFAPFF